MCVISILLSGFLKVKSLDECLNDRFNRFSCLACIHKLSRYQILLSTFHRKYIFECRHIIVFKLMGTMHCHLLAYWNAILTVTNVYTGYLHNTSRK